MELKPVEAELLWRTTEDLISRREELLSKLRAARKAGKWYPAAEAAIKHIRRIELELKRRDVIL